MADRVRLSLFCPSCLPGYHLPFFTAASSGIFTAHDLDVEILDPPPAPGSLNTHRVAEGGAEFGLTGVTYFLIAKKEGGPALAARFVAVLHQRSPLGAIVPADSAFRVAEDLPGRRVGRGEFTGWLAEECTQALADRGLDAPEYVDLPHGDAPYALGRGDIDFVATMVDTVAGIAVKAGVPTRAIHLGADIYSSGIIAADSVPSDVVARMRSAVAAAFELQRCDPESAVAEYCARFTDVEPDRARHGWDLLQSFASCEQGVGTMVAERWARTLAWVNKAHAFPPIDPSQTYRPEFAG